jgi:alkanesulfonate monooxygenase SsuD/methylene tetrahydromethanopterin reductase-like flavin-dependent oxidoreductase (luciferase family)
MGQTNAGVSECERWGIGVAAKCATFGTAEDGIAVGIALGGPTRPDYWAPQLDWVDRAEAMGLHSVWLPEMHLTATGCAQPLLGLTAFAARTQRLRLGTSSLLLPIHPPHELARYALDLDRLSNGRLILGLGRGFRRALFDAFGVDPATKRDVFDASLDIILANWPGDPPPLAVAAFGRKGLMQSARRGLPYLASPLEPLSMLEENYAYHRESLPDHLRDAEPVVPVMRVVYVARDDAETTRVMAALEGENAQVRRTTGKLPAAIARAAAAPARERVIVGVRREVEDRVAEYRERLGVNLLIVRPQLGGVEFDAQVAAMERLIEL